MFVINVLRACGCIEAQNEPVGNLDVDNIVALSGAWDVVGTSLVTDRLKLKLLLALCLGSMMGWITRLLIYWVVIDNDGKSPGALLGIDEGLGLE